MTALSILQDAATMMSLPRPTNFSGAATPLSLTMAQLSTIGGKVLSRSHDWQNLTITKTFNPLPQTAQTGNPPTNFDRFPPQMRIWDVNRRRWLTGPMTSAQWAQILSGWVPTWPFYWTRQQGSLQIWPAPEATDLFRYQYVTKNWVRPEGAPDDGSLDTAAWVNGTDTALISEDLLLLDLVWRFKQAKGLDYAEDMGTFEREKEKIMARDRGPSIIATAAFYDDPLTNDRPYTWPGQVVP